MKGEDYMETILNQWWAYILLGIVAGIFRGMLGIGSGTILIPGLVFLFYFSQKSAQGTALAVMVPMVLVGAIRYYLNPEIKLNLTYIGLIAGGAVAGAFIGTALVYYFPGNILRKFFAVFLIIVGFKMFLTKPKSINMPSVSKPPVNHGVDSNYSSVKKI